MIEERLSRLVDEAVEAAARDLDVDGPRPSAQISVPKQKAHGDFSTNVALVLAASTDRSARETAEAIRERLPSDPVVRGDSFGRAEPNGRSVQVEFVSANPTGPLHIGHARNAALGDAVANALAAAGATVEREFYFNDAGGQMDRFGASVEARYLQRFGVDAEVPQDGYHGEYIGELAADVAKRFGDAFVGLDPQERLT